MADVPPSRSRHRPGALGRVLHDRTLRLTAGLAVAVTIPVALLFYFQFRSLADLERASAVVLRQMSQETADHLLQRLEEEFRGPYLDALLRIRPSDADALALDTVGPVYARALDRYDFVDAFFVSAREGSVFPGELLVFSRADNVTDEEPATRGNGEPWGRLVELGGHAFRVGTPEEASIAAAIRDLMRYKRTLVTWDQRVRGVECRMVFQLAFDTPARERVTSFSGFCANLGRVRFEQMPRLVRQTLAAGHEGTGFPPLVVTVLDEAGRIVYQTEPADPDSFVHERRLPLVFFSTHLLEVLVPYRPQVEYWTMRTGYGDQAIADIVRARTLPQVGLMIALALGLTCGAFFVVRAAAREVRLAELKSSFVASVSHDLKTPLALIQLFAETLELGRLKTQERATEYARIIKGEARKLTRLINNILDFSRMEAGLRFYRLVPLDLAELVDRVIESHASQFEHNRFTVTRTAQPGVPAVMGDAEAIEQALDNLLSNAMKYSRDDREIRVHVGCEGAVASISVTDRGVGISRPHLRRIFRKFYRVNVDHADAPPGCGLGLAIVDHVMRAHDGEVRVESEPGRGSTFSLVFPVPVEGMVYEADPGGRRRTADAARPA